MYQTTALAYNILICAVYELRECLEYNDAEENVIKINIVPSPNKNCFLQHDFVRIVVKQAKAGALSYTKFILCFIDSTV